MISSHLTECKWTNDKMVVEETNDELIKWENSENEQKMENYCMKQLKNEKLIAQLN